MPTVLIVGKFAVRIYTQDHGPAHVHVVCGEGNLKVYLESEHEPELRGRMRPSEVRKAIDLVAAHYEALLSEWQRIHPRQ